MSTRKQKNSNQNLLAKEADFSSTLSIIDKAIKENIFPSCVASVYQFGQPIFQYSVGVSGVRKDGTQIISNLETVYDLAEITQVVATVPLLMMLVEQGKLDLNHRVSRYLSTFNVHGKSTVTIGHLLSHTSGLAGDFPFYEFINNEHGTSGFGVLTNKGASDYVVNNILRSSLKYPQETKQSYSDQGFILLGAIIELLCGSSLDKVLLKYLIKPLGLKSTSYIDIAMLKRKALQAIPEVIAATDFCSFRNRLIWGEVFDLNAWAMGGVAGHAGLFSNIRDLQTIGNSMLYSLLNKPQKDIVNLFHPRVIQSFIIGGQFDIPVTYLYGFDKPHRENGLIDAGLTEKSFGLVSSTGCMFWIEPEIERVIVILTNKLDLSRNSRKLINFRQEFCRSLSD